MYLILSISDSNKHFQTPIEEYAKRLGKCCQIIDLKPAKHGTRDQIVHKETEIIRNRIQKYKQKGFAIVLLAKEGGKLSTEQFHQRYTHRDVVFLIGGPYGVEESLLSDLVDDRISLGGHTMPHGLAKLVLLEQLYRIHTIEQGRQYHY